MTPDDENELLLLRKVLHDAREVLFASIKAPDALQNALGTLNLSCRAHWDWQTTRLKETVGQDHASGS